MRLCSPWSAAGHNGVGEDEQLSGAGDECNFVHLSSSNQSFVERDQLWIPAERGGKSGSVKGTTQARATAQDVTGTDQIAAVAIIWSKPCKRSRLLARNAADLRHAHHNRDCGWQSDAIHAVDQIEPLAEVAVLADCRNEALKLGFLSLFETGDLRLPGLADARISARFVPVLEHCDVFDDLLNHRQMLGKRHQARIWGRMDLLDCRRATRDQGCVNFVVLGTLQVENRISPHLRRLKHDDHEASAT